MDDCYNANPMSMKASLDVLHDGAGRRVAILGDMGELGENEAALHREVGAHAASCGIDACVCAGSLARHIAEAAREKNPEFPVFYEGNQGEPSEKSEPLCSKGRYCPGKSLPLYEVRGGSKSAGRNAVLTYKRTIRLIKEYSYVYGCSGR